MKSFQELRVWQRSVEIVKQVYQMTKQFPENEKYGLAIQMRRSAVSIPSNIAEGHVRGTAKEFKQFVSIARGSCAELQTQTVIAHELGYITESTLNTFLNNLESLAKMLSSLYGRL